MKHYFIINPAAGKGTLYKNLDAELRGVCGTLGIDYVIYYTKGIGDAEDYVRREGSLGEGRFYACGGDGTLSEVINGANGLAGVSVGVIPIGTGNDFARNFTPHEKFFNIGAQIGGSVRELDLIKYNGRYAAVTLNVGFDAEVVMTVAKIKKNRAVPGKLAYMISALYGLIKKHGIRLEASVDGGGFEERDLLLCCVGNSGYCGGGFNSGPRAELSDGLLDVCFVKNVGRIRFLSLLGAYKKGSFLEKRGIGEVIDYVKCRSLEIRLPREHGISVDGEIVGSDSLSVAALPGALSFILPEGCALKKEAPELSFVPA